MYSCGNFSMSEKTMSNAFDVVRQFEQRVAEYAGAPHAVAVDSCSNAILLSLLWRAHAARPHLTVPKFSSYDDPPVLLPCHTYPSVPSAVIHAGALVRFVNFEWSGAYELAWDLSWSGRRHGMLSIVD